MTARQRPRALSRRHCNLTNPQPAGALAAWAEIHEIQHDAGLEATPIPAPLFDPDYNLIRYRGLSDLQYWLVIAGFLALIGVCVVIGMVWG